MDTAEVVGIFRFGKNTIQADQTGNFILHLVNGGEWVFDLGEIDKLDKILLDFQLNEKNAGEKTFWRTNGSKVIRVEYRISGDTPLPEGYIFISDGGIRNGYFRFSETSELRKNIQILTSEGAPYGRPIKLIEVIEEGRQEEFVAKHEIPLNNRNSKSPLIVEREFTREEKKAIQIETSFNVGVDYYIHLNLESQYGVTKEEKISERIMVKMEAKPGEHILFTITWIEVWIKGYAIFDAGNNNRERIPFRIKSGLEPHISQETIT